MYKTLKQNYTNVADGPNIQTAEYSKLVKQ